MPQTYKILGQVFTTPNTLTNVYVTDSSTSAVVNSLYVCNQDSVSANVNIILRPISEALADKHFYVYEQVVDGASTYVLNLGITMGSDTILAANSFYVTGLTKTAANISYGAFGLEIT